MFECMYLKVLQRPVISYILIWRSIRFISFQNYEGKERQKMKNISQTVSSGGPHELCTKTNEIHQKPKTKCSTKMNCAMRVSRIRV